jgi:hypothetical protein
MDEHVLAAIVTDDETEALLRIEEFDDALAFADDLRGHSTTAAASAAAEAAASATAAKASTSAAAKAATVAEATAAAAAAAAAVTESAAAAIATALLETTAAEFTAAEILFAETFALVAAAPSAVAFTPSVETHARPNSSVPQIEIRPSVRRALRRNRSVRFPLAHGAGAYRKNLACSSDSIAAGWRVPPEQD